MIFEGTVHKYGQNVDTDVIIPARYLNTTDPAELAPHCMEDIDADFVQPRAAGRHHRRRRELRLRQLARARAGRDQGRRRERASSPRPSRASSTATRSTSGCRSWSARRPPPTRRTGDRLRVDLAAGTVENLTQGKTYDAEAFPPFMQELIDRGGLIDVREVPARRRERLVTTPANLQAATAS